MSFINSINITVRIVIFIALLIALVLTVIEICFPFKLVRRTRTVKVESLIATVLSICAILEGASIFSSGNSTPNTPKASAHANSGKPASLQILIPQKATPGNPLPQVACSHQLAVTGRIPAGYVVIEGNKVTSNTDWYFIPVNQTDATHWNETVYFGQPSDAGQEFNIVVFAMPQSWENYLVSLYGSRDPKAGGGWGFSDLPPTRTATVEENVRRTAAKKC